jgi:hypothetical protein
MKINVSFKRKEKDMHDYLMKQLSPGIFLKQLLKNEMERQEPKIKRDFLNF